MKENSLITRQIMGLGKPLEEDSCGPKDSVLQKQALYLKGGVKAAWTGLEAMWLRMNMDLKRKSSSKFAAVAVKCKAQGTLQQSFDDSGQPLLSLQIPLILLTSYTRSIKKPQSKSNQWSAPSLQQRAELWSQAFAPNCASDGGGR